MKPSARRVALCALLAAAAMILGFLESLIPFPLPIPGMKLGLANLATLFALYHLTAREAAAIIVVRCALSALLFGGVAALPYSLAGGLCSLAAMAPAMHSGRLSPYGVGIAGAAAHSVAQVTVAAVAFSSAAMFSYLVPLLPASVITGAAMALIFRAFDRAVGSALRV